MNIHISEALSEMVEPMVDAYIGAREIISTEDFKAGMEKLNDENYRVSQKKVSLSICYISPLLKKLQNEWLYCWKDGFLLLVLNTERPQSNIWLLRYGKLKLLDQEMENIFFSIFTKIHKVTKSRINPQQKLRSLWNLTHKLIKG